MQGQNTAAALNAALQFAPVLIQKTEDANPDGGNGPDKHELVKNAIVIAATGVEAGVAAANPAYAGVISVADYFIRMFFAARKARGQAVVPAKPILPAPVSIADPGLAQKVA